LPGQEASAKTPAVISLDNLTIPGLRTFSAIAASVAGAQIKRGRALMPGLWYVFSFWLNQPNY